MLDLWSSERMFVIEDMYTNPNEMNGALTMILQGITGPGTCAIEMNFVMNFVFSLVHD